MIKPVSNAGRSSAWQHLIFGVLVSLLAIVPVHAAEVARELKDLTINGGIHDGKARLIIDAVLNGRPGGAEKVIYATKLNHTIAMSSEKIVHSIAATVEILQGTPEELAFRISGDGEIERVIGDTLKHWSVRQETNGVRTLVLNLRSAEPQPNSLAATIVAKQANTGTNVLNLLTLTPEQPALLSGYVRVDWPAELQVELADSSGLTPIELGFLPQEMRPEKQQTNFEPLAFRFHGTAYNLSIDSRFADPEARRVVLREFQLIGWLTNNNAAFVLTATAHVRKPGELELLAGNVALTDLKPNRDWRMRVDQNRFMLEFDQPGEFPIRLEFDAAVTERDGWRRIDFRVAPSVVQPIELRGLAPETQFEFAGAAQLESAGTQFVSYLPPDGTVRLSWKEARPEVEGKLFYAAEMLSQISVGPGLMRQSAIIDFKVMQGELNRMTLLLRGFGEVIRVQGDDILSWTVAPAPDSPDRHLTVEFNQPQKDQFTLLVQLQTPLGAFPQAVDVVELRPQGATRFAGYFRIINEGAVRLEVAEATGVSQISPEQFPETDLTRALFQAAGGQRFAYRFSGGEFALRIQADQIQPELSVSELLGFHQGENESSIDAEIELDIREAPLRELVIGIPAGYALARVSASGLADYFQSDTAGSTNSQLRLVYGQPIMGRQVVQLRLERNEPLTATNWSLPRIEIDRAKSVRGHLAVSADPGLRLVPEQTQGLTEIATALFPRRVAGIQTAFRISEPGWEAILRIERLPQSIQADVFHLFSIGERIAYGSSVINYLISGAPVSEFRVELSDEYYNVEFTGNEVRNWQKVEGGYVVQLHTPVSGAYALLASYERPFQGRGETLEFTGARPADAQSEQGYTIVISAYQFQVNPVDISAGLLPLEPGEVPAEYRLFFDAPVLAAYRYTSRPFNLSLALSPLQQGESLSQVVDRASLTTQISKEGQVLTDVRYFLKNRGHPHFRIELPDGTQLWSVRVNGSAVVPVADGNANLIPLPAGGDPNSVLTLDLKLASRSKKPTRVAVATPRVGAPVMLASWKIEPDTGQRLAYRKGSLTPVGGIQDTSGFAQLNRAFSGRDSERAVVLVLAALGLLAITAMVWRWSDRDDVYRFSIRHIAATVVGLVAIVMAVAALIGLIDLVDRNRIAFSNDLEFVAPVQESGSVLTVEVTNIPQEMSAPRAIGRAWPALLAIVLWTYGWLVERPFRKRLAWIAGWTLLAWAALRSTNGAPAFLVLMLAFAFLHVVIPGLRNLSRAPRRPAGGPASAGSGPTPAVASLLIGFLGLVFESGAPVLGATPTPQRDRTAVAESVIQVIRVEDKTAFATARIRWQASEGELLPLLFEPGVLTRASYPTNTLRLVQASVDSKRARQLLAEKGGEFEVELHYQTDVVRKENETGFTLPAAHGLINKVNLTLVGLDVDVSSPQAASVTREMVGTNTVASLVLAPVNNAWIAWKPRTRDVKHEKPAFYAELVQLYVPSSGVIEGAHHVAIRPAQGQLSELTFAVPDGATITDVFTAPSAGAQPEPQPNSASAPSTPLVSLWRFDPEARRLRVQLSSPQSRTFGLIIRSQIATGPLPYEQSVGLLSIEDSAGQIGMLGIATGNDVQIENVTADEFSPINLEDFPNISAGVIQIPGLTVRRAFRYTNPGSIATVSAAPVQPDVRAEMQQTVSLGEDRTVLAAQMNVEITRAGIFRLSFALPNGFDVESISGPALSHWTDLRNENERLITLHLRGKTEGQQQFAISLAGPGVKAVDGWTVPQLTIREANKQRGVVMIVPEQGMRLEVVNRSGVTQLDPEKSGIRQKGVLAFRVLQVPWAVELNVQQVDAWVQVNSLQQAIVTDAQLKVAANLQYQIENTGLKSFRVLLPANAESVRFEGSQVADFLPVTGAVTNNLQAWEIKLHRRVIGRYVLQATYQILLTDQAAEIVIHGVQAADVNLQRGYVTVQSGGRTQVRPVNLPPALQPTEWQSIPRSLRQNLPAAAATLAYRLVDPAFQLPLQLERHAAAKLLPARVTKVTFTSVISDEGAMLTRAQLEMLPGDKRLLYLTLPKGGRFWFAFVNEHGVWPWREQDRILIPLESQAGGKANVEVFFSSDIGDPSRNSLDLELAAPKFDLPLEDLTWNVYLSPKWRLKDWAGTMQLHQERIVSATAELNLQQYLETEIRRQNEKTRQAESLLNTANQLLEGGDPQEARRAFRAAYGLSTHDNAFNEDARVQLHNLKVQQALMGLNVRQAAVAGEAESLSGKLRPTGRNELNYTQQQAKDVIGRQPADESAAFTRLAERLIQQQDAAIAAPAAIRASVPEQGRLLTFKRAVVVDSWADLRIDLEVVAARAASWRMRILILTATFLLLAVIVWAGKRKSVA